MNPFWMGVIVGGMIGAAAGIFTMALVQINREGD